MIKILNCKNKNKHEYCSQKCTKEIAPTASLQSKVLFWIRSEKDLIQTMKRKRKMYFSKKKYNFKSPCLNSHQSLGPDPVKSPDLDPDPKHS